MVAFRVVGILGVDIMLGVGEERKLWCKRRMELGVPWDRLDLGGLRVLVIGVGDSRGCSGRWYRFSRILVVGLT